MNYTPEQRKLANEIAETLDDRDAITLHLSYAQKYQDSFLRKVLMKVMSVPDHKIRKSRGALFTSLIKQHAGNQDTRY